MPTYRISYVFTLDIKAQDEEEAEEKYWERFRDAEGQEVDIKIVEDENAGI
jgi:hypothetical protein